MRIATDFQFWLKAAAVAIVILGAALRCIRAATLGLNPDEALQLLACHRESIAEALAQMARFHHPPLYLLLTYLVRPLLFDEWGARLIAVVAGSLLPVILFIWLRTRLGLVGACTALIVTALSPNLISLSAQVRSYSLAMLLAALTLLWLDQGIDRGRLGRIALAGIALALAILTDFSLAIVCPAIALYGLARLRETSAPRAYWIGWACAIGAALVIFGLLYWFQVRNMPLTARDFGQTWLRGGFRPAGQLLPVFLAAASVKQFAYLAGSPAGGVILLAVFAVAIPAASLAWRLLLLTPFATGLTLSLLQLLPFGRSRHSAIVSICVAAGLALAAHSWLKFRPRLWLLAAPLTMVLLVCLAGGDPMDKPSAELDRRALRSAHTYLASIVPPGAPILATSEARLMVACYRLMERQPPLPVESFRRGLRLKGPAELEEAIAQLRRRHTIASGDPVYFVEGGFFPVEFPQSVRAEELRKFGFLRVWRLFEQQR